MIVALSPELENLGWGLAAIGITLVTLSLVMGIRKKRRKMGGRVTARENLERYKAKSEVRDDLQRVMVEVEEMAKRVAAQLDAKTIAVEKLLREADARIERLHAAAERFEQIRAAATRDGSPPGGTASADPPGPPDAPPPTPTSPEDELSRRVYALADQGHAAPIIARQLGEHIGKVELILALRSA